MAERKPTIQKEVSSFAERTKNAVPYEVTEPTEVERVPQIVTPEEPAVEKPVKAKASKKKKKSVK